MAAQAILIIESGLLVDEHRENKNEAIDGCLIVLCGGNSLYISIQNFLYLVRYELYCSKVDWARK